MLEKLCFAFQKSDIYTQVLNFCQCQVTEGRDRLTLSHAAFAQIAQTAFGAFG